MNMMNMKKREAEKEYILGIIKELFGSGRIDVDINIYNKWEEKLADVIIKIDGEKVHTCTSRIGWTDWSDD